MLKLCPGLILVPELVLYDPSVGSEVDLVDDGGVRGVWSITGCVGEGREILGLEPHELRLRSRVSGGRAVRRWCVQSKLDLDFLLYRNSGRGIENNGKVQYCRARSVALFVMCCRHSLLNRR